MVFICTRSGIFGFVGKLWMVIYESLATEKNLRWFFNWLFACLIVAKSKLCKMSVAESGSFWQKFGFFFRQTEHGQNQANRKTFFFFKYWMQQQLHGRPLIFALFACTQTHTCNTQKSLSTSKHSIISYSGEKQKKVMHR